MKFISQIVVLITLLSTGLSGQEGQGEVEVDWRALKIAKSYFPRSIGLMDAERDDYAGNLAGAAVLHLRANKANRDSLEVARRLMSLALHLSPRNKQAVVINAQLARGVVPNPPDTDYRPQTLARLLMKRAQLLEKQEGESNIELAGFLFSLAADLDPENVDAIYLNELYRINHGEVGWTKLFVNKE